MQAGVVIALLVGPIVLLVAALVSGAAASGRLARNTAVGIRLPATLASDDAWRAGHHAAVLPAWIAFGACAIVDVVLVLARADRVIVIAVPNLLLLVAIAWIGTASVLAARRAR